MLMQLLMLLTLGWQVHEVQGNGIVAASELSFLRRRTLLAEDMPTEEKQDNVIEDNDSKQENVLDASAKVECTPTGTCVRCDEKDSKYNRKYCRKTGYKLPIRCGAIASSKEKMSKDGSSILSVNGDSSTEKSASDTGNEQLEDLKRKSKVAGRSHSTSLEGVTFDTYESCSSSDSRYDIEGEFGGASMFRFMLLTLMLFMATAPVLVWRKRMVFDR